MRSLQTFTLLLISSIVIFACKKWFHPECRDDAATTTGIILRELNSSCTHFLDHEREEVITRKSRWDSMWANPKYPYSGDCPVPVVDFETETVLLFHSGVGPGFREIRNVERDENAREYVYTIKQIDCSNKRNRNEIISSNDNAMVVPKLPLDWSVRFVTETDD